MNLTINGNLIEQIFILISVWNIIQDPVYIYSEV